MTDAAPEPNRILLHVGSPKTGTTFLQQVLWSQRAAAAEQGLLLPGERFFHHYLASLDVRGLSSRPEHPEEAKGIWPRLVAEAEAWPGTVLISHELFASARADQCRAALDAFSPATEVHVVLTARDLVRQIPAEWQEHVKHRSTTSLPAFVSQIREDQQRHSWFWRVQDFADILERWGSTLAPERFHVVTFPPVGADPDALWRRFSALLGLQPDTFDTRRTRSNSSLGLEQAELLRRVNRELGGRLPLPGPYTRVIKNILAHRVLAERKGTPLTLDAEDAAFARRQSARIAERLHASGIDVVGDLGELVPDDGAAGHPDSYLDAADEVVAEEAVAALAATYTILSHRITAHQEALDRVKALRERPFRVALGEASRQRPLLGKARKGYELARGLRSRLAHKDS